MSLRKAIRPRIFLVYNFDFQKSKMKNLPLKQNMILPSLFKMHFTIDVLSSSFRFDNSAVAFHASINGFFVCFRKSYLNDQEA